MNFSEDPSSPAAPFSGDTTGQIFDLPDMVADSATTAERVVDTQSGFLIVVKRSTAKVFSGLALSVKRRIGTPPASSVALTPDETLKLSRILASSLDGGSDGSLYGEQMTAGATAIASPESVRSSRRRARAQQMNGNSPSSRDGETTIPDLVLPTGSMSNARISMKLMLGSVTRTFMVPIVGIVLSIFAIGWAAGVSIDKFINADHNAAKSAALVDPLAPEKVDAFVRSFATRMLDFSASSYKISQVQAMAAMTPELLERYWVETKFPLSKRQLKALPTGTSIMITELKQERIDANTVQVILKALLSDAANPKVATPVNLQLKLAVGPDQTIVVMDQQDISSTTSPSEPAPSTNSAAAPSAN